MTAPLTESLAFISRMAKKHDISIPAAESKWKKAKAIALAQGHRDDYAVVTGIFKNMVGESVISQAHSTRSGKVTIPVQEGKVADLDAAIGQQVDSAIAAYQKNGDAVKLSTAKKEAAQRIASEFDMPLASAVKFVGDYCSEHNPQYHNKSKPVSTTSEALNMTFIRYLAETATDKKAETKRKAKMLKLISTVKQ